MRGRKNRFPRECSFVGIFVYIMKRDDVLMTGRIYKMDGKTMIGRYDSSKVFRSGHACTFIGRFESGVIMEGSYTEVEAATYDSSGNVFVSGSTEAVGRVLEGKIYKGSELVGMYVGDAEGSAAAGYLLLMRD